MKRSENSAMAKKKEKQPEPIWKDNVCEGRTCGQCCHLTNVPDERRSVPNVMGGCFVTGIIVSTDLNSCKDFEEYGT